LWHPDREKKWVAITLDPGAKNIRLDSVLVVPSGLVEQ